MVYRSHRNPPRRILYSEQIWQRAGSACWSAFHAVGVSITLPENIREPRPEAEYRTVRLVTISSSVYTAYDVVLERDGCPWEVVEKRSLFQVFS